VSLTLSLSKGEAMELQTDHAARFHASSLDKLGMRKLSMRLDAK
jgi:hypothetical protein